MKGVNGLYLFQNISKEVINKISPEIRKEIRDINGIMRVRSLVNTSIIRRISEWNVI